MEALGREAFDEARRAFEELGLAEPLLEAIRDMHFEHPTHVQTQLIPLALGRRDILGQSKTGTGKTAAFGLPVLNHLLETGTEVCTPRLRPSDHDMEERPFLEGFTPETKPMSSRMALPWHRGSFS